MTDLMIPKNTTSVSGKCVADWFDTASKKGPESEKRSNHCDSDFDASSPMIPGSLKERVLYWVSKNPGVYAEDVAMHFQIHPVDASDLVEQLLNEGLLDFDE